MHPSTEGILESSLYVTDVARSAQFYEKIFGFRVISDFGERGCAMEAGNRQVWLLFRKGGRRPTQSRNDGDGGCHVALRITSEGPRRGVTGMPGGGGRRSAASVRRHKFPPRQSRRVAQSSVRSPVSRQSAARSAPDSRAGTNSLPTPSRSATRPNAVRDKSSRYAVPARRRRAPAPSFCREQRGR